MIINPILRGFCPDPSIIWAKGKYYIATSTFEWWPGVRLFESKDLKRWKQIDSPLNRKSQLDLTGDPPSGGVWAPCLSYDGSRYYLVYTDVKTKKGRFYNTNNYVVWADDIYGKWSDPVYLNSIGFDPSLFHDRDGRKYLVNMINGFKGITVQEISPDNMKPVGERVHVYDGSGIGCLEGPHIYHIGDFYYLVVAEGGTGYDHCVTLARSDSVYGPYITCPDNPILTSDKEGLLQKCGHASLVETPQHEWYMAYLCSRPVKEAGGCILGRETAIQKMILNKDGWFKTQNADHYGQVQTPEPLAAISGEDDEGSGPEKEAAFHDSFDKENIDVAYSSLRWDYNNFSSIDKVSSKLILRGEESLNSLHHVSLLATRQQNIACMAETCMDFRPRSYQQLAGIVYMYDNLNFYIFGKSLNEAGERILVLLKSDKGDITDLIEPVIIDNDDPVKLRIETDGASILFSYSFDDNWIGINAQADTHILTDEYCRGFTGAHMGMYIHDMLEKKALAKYDYWHVESRQV
ncbi:MAG: glycoside hydrolase family 43 protein [Lachnospiraceae bacterium]|nr:glycoside hydrolase family 43 protein [Lachnospiraceae bacterium]